MYSNFSKINIEKKYRILNAALDEFARNGYKKASTDNIVKAANISKGSLFYYFKNKKRLFLFIYDYTLDVLVKEFFIKIDLSETDLFTRLRQMLVIKYKIIKQYPEMFNFILAAYNEDLHSIKEELEKKNKEFTQNSFNKLLLGINLSKFKDGLDIKKCINIIVWTLERLSQEESKKVKGKNITDYDYDSIMFEVDKYLDLLRCCFYK